jgi:hypothetical protein
MAVVAATADAAKRPVARRLAATMDVQLIPRAVAITDARLTQVVGASRLVAATVAADAVIAVVCSAGCLAAIASAVAIRLANRLAVALPIAVAMMVATTAATLDALIRLVVAKRLLAAVDTSGVAVC